MKKVVSNAMVCHLWANQSQEEARNGNGTLFFEGPCLYSYRRSFKIGEIVTAPNGETFYFLNDNTYSNATCKHETLAYRAIPDGMTCISINMQADIFGYSYFNAANAYKSSEYLAGTIKTFLGLQAKARGYDYMQRINKIWEDYRLINQAWGHTYYSLSSFPLYSEAMERLEKIKEKAKDKEAQRQRTEAEKRAEQLEKVAKWFLGKNVGDLSLIPIHLRMSTDGTHIETTKGASVPVSDAVKVWDAITQGNPIHGQKIGSFTCISSDSEAIKIGCHIIPMDIARKFMEQLMAKA